MKKFFLLLFLSSVSLFTFADHIKGGFFTYEYVGPGINDPTKLRYDITLTVYMECDPNNGQKSNPINFTFFNAATNQFLENVPVNIIQEFNLAKNFDEPCITGNQSKCYYTIIIYKLKDKELTPLTDGYTVAYQRCCRIRNMENIISSGNIGTTFAINIPGTKTGLTAEKNSSPKFPINDTAVVCANNFFTYSFQANDQDGDSLSYSFCDALKGAESGTTGFPAPTTASNPPYNSVPYPTPYNGTQPMGQNVTIDPVTGLISGIAPSYSNTGEFVISICIYEWRQGVNIATSRKELHIVVNNCQPLKAQLNPIPTLCDGFTVNLANAFDNGVSATYLWDFGDPKSGGQNTSTLPTPSHTYSDTGVYKIKLKISFNGLCTDSTTALVKVYPGFFPGYISAGQCKNTPIQFTDTTKTNYGVVNSWSWNFGDPSSANNTSAAKNPQHTFSVSGNYNVSLSVSNSKGCSSVITQTISIKDKPDFTVTNDTLICSIDTLQLNAVGNGNFFWTPNYNINNQNSASPLVSPDVPTMYYVRLTDSFGCIGNDSVFVDVKQFVTLDAGKDTGICAGDAIQLNPISDALNYNWSPSAPLNNNTLKNPIATPSVTTKFFVIGNIGKCQATDSVIVRVAPYPGVNGIPDTTLCFGNSIQFNATGGSMYTWSPTFFLNNPNIPNPVATPDRTIRYIVTIRDTLGCPKPSFDTIVVTVQKVIANAGPRDTSIVINQPLQLNATGGQFYLWSPSTGLNNPAIANPIATISDNIDYVVRASTAAGCFATDTISVKVYKVLPSIFVPSAFSPDGDGKNDFFRPIPVGIKQINYFKVFNRWGVLVYSSTKTLYEQNTGWDGRFKGKPQDSDVYVWIVEGVDYLDKKITQKGSVTLIR